MDARKPQNSRVGPFPGLGQLRTWALSDSDLARSPGRLPTQSGRCAQGTGKQGQQPPTLHPSSFSQEEKPSSALFLHRVHSPREAPGAGGVTPQGSRDTNRKGPRGGRMEGTMASVSGTGVHSGHGEGQGAGAALPSHAQGPLVPSPFRLMAGDEPLGRSLRPGSLPLSKSGNPGWGKPAFLVFFKQ